MVYGSLSFHRDTSSSCEIVFDMNESAALKFRANAQELIALKSSQSQRIFNPLQNIPIQNE